MKDKNRTGFFVFMFAVWMGSLPALAQLVNLREYTQLSAALVLGACLHATTRAQFRLYQLNLELGVTLAGSLAAIVAGWTAWWFGPDNSDRIWVCVAAATGMSQLVLTAWILTRPALVADPPRPRRVMMVDKNLTVHSSDDDAGRAWRRKYLEDRLASMAADIETLPDRVGADAHQLGRAFMLFLEVSRLNVTMTADSIDAHKPQLEKILRELGELQQYFAGSDRASIAVRDLAEKYLRATGEALRSRA